MEDEEMIKLDDVRMELVQVREAIDMAETVLEVKEDLHIRTQLVQLKKEEAMLVARLQEWKE